MYEQSSSSALDSSSIIRENNSLLCVDSVAIDDFDSRSILEEHLQ